MSRNLPSVDEKKTPRDSINKVTGLSYALELKNISFAYQVQSVINNLNLSFSNGEIVALTGPNGVGKTTLLRIIAGLKSESEGEIYWQGQPADVLVRRFLCHWISTEFPLKRKLSVEENLKFIMALKTGAFQDRTKIRDALAMMNIDLLMNKRIDTLSAGQMSRVFLASLLLDQRPVWLLDEPNTALDNSGRTILNSLIRKTAKKHNTIVILATHEPAYFECDRIIDLMEVGV